MGVSAAPAYRKAHVWMGPWRGNFDSGTHGKLAGEFFFLQQPFTCCLIWLFWDVLINPPNPIQGATALICNQLVFIYWDTWEGKMENAAFQWSAVVWPRPRNVIWKHLRLQGPTTLPESNTPKADWLGAHIRNHLPLLSANQARCLSLCTFAY